SRSSTYACRPRDRLERNGSTPTATGWAAISFPRALIDDHGGVTARDPIQLRFIPCCRVARSPRSSPSQPRQNGDADDGDRDDDDGRLGEQPSDTLDHAAEEGRGEVRLHRPFE